MRISARTRYSLAVLVYMAERYETGEWATVISLSEKLQISKIYLEQVFALLKRSGIVLSTKGARGGYRLSRPTRDITAFDILSATETFLLEKTEETVSDERIEKTIRDAVFEPLDVSIKETLSHVTLEDMVNQMDLHWNSEHYMSYGI